MLICPCQSRTNQGRRCSADVSVWNYQRRSCSLQRVLISPDSCRTFQTALPALRAHDVDRIIWRCIFNCCSSHNLRNHQLLQVCAPVHDAVLQTGNEEASDPHARGKFASVRLNFPPTRSRLSGSLSGMPLLRSSANSLSKHWQISAGAVLTPQRHSGFPSAPSGTRSTTTMGVENQCLNQRSIE